MRIRSLEHCPSSRERGSALVLVLFCLILMATAFLGIIDLLTLRADFASHRELDLDAESLARSGFAIASNPLIKPDDPLLNQTVAANRAFHAIMVSEGARLNLNFLLAIKDRTTLTNLFTAWGLNADECNRVIDCLNDWISPDVDIHSLNGASDSDYQQAGLSQRPSHRLFQSLKEVELVMGFNLVMKHHPNWQESFTIYSSGPLDLSQATAELIAATTGADISQTRQLVNLRNGPDKIPGTSDDVPIQGLADLQSALSLNSEQLNQIQRLVSFSDPIRRIESEGISGDRHIHITAVFRPGTNELRAWSVH